MGVTKTQVVKFIRKGEAGENGISIFVLPASLTAKLGTANIYKVQIALYDGGVQIPYNDPNNGNMLCSTLPSSDTYTWRFTVDNGKFYYNIYTSPKELGLMIIPFTVTYKDVTYDSVINIQVVKDGDKGDKGDRGPTLRGPQAWSDCATGYAFQAGGAGEKWQDVVLYNGNYYSCKKSHTKTTSNYPGSTTDTNNGYWQLGDNIELVATKILLATYALVKNLGVEAIDMKDANGNILFQAKDGNVTCKTGTFENVKVIGDIEAKNINLKISSDSDDDSPIIPDGAVISGAANHKLPKLQIGECRTIKWVHPLMTRTVVHSRLEGEDNTVFIAPNGNVFDSVNIYDTIETGCFELIGLRGNSDYTYWHLFRIPMSN